MKLKHTAGYCKKHKIFILKVKDGKVIKAKTKKELMQNLYKYHICKLPFKPNKVTFQKFSTVKDLVTVEIVIDEDARRTLLILRFEINYINFKNKSLEYLKFKIFGI